MLIAADKNQFSGSHGKNNEYKHKQLANMGHEVIPVPLPFGDYCLITEQMQETINRRGSKLKKADLVGDISISVDTKKNLSEACQNICSGSHNRFRDEVILAQKCGCKLYILIEDNDITCLEKVSNWVNPRIKNYEKIKQMHSMGKWKSVPEPKAPPTSGSTLQKAMTTMSEKYGCEFLFCKPDETGERIISLLKS